jgi:hypothetical protein
MDTGYEIVRETGTHKFIRFAYFKDFGLPDLKLKKDVGPHLDINGNQHHWEIAKCALKPQSDYPEKIFSIQLMKESSSGKKEVRIGYYIVGKKDKYKNKWAWGQFCPFIPQKDLKEICELLKEENFY